MKLILCTLALNEMEWLPKLYEQHKNWPGLEKWVFVEAADRVYADCNVGSAAADGLSVDGTSAFLRDLAAADPRVEYIAHGITSSADPAQGKCPARNRYLDVAEEVKPDFLMVLDADEFYTHEAQRQIDAAFSADSGHTAFCFPQLNVWRPPSVEHWSLFSYQVADGFWAIPHVRGWRWQEGLRYRSNHNTPETSSGARLDARLVRAIEPLCVHMGFAASQRSRAAKHRYYAARGEGRTDFRGWYVDSRAAWETWRPGSTLPRGAKVTAYSGPIPECFQEQAVRERATEKGARQ